MWLSISTLLYLISIYSDLCYGLRFQKCTQEQDENVFCDCSDILTTDVPLQQNHWIEIPNIPVELFSAYVDLQNFTLPYPKPANTVTVRIVAHGLQREYNKGVINALHCHLWSDLEKQWVHFGKGHYLKIYDSRLHHNEWTAHFVLCHVPMSLYRVTRMLAVGLGTHLCGIGAALSITESTKERLPAISTAICVSPLYGRVHPTQLAEFVEIHRIFGVQHFTFYIYSVLSETDRLLRYYQLSGIATLINWSTYNRRQQYFYFDQRSALNDCFYRNRHTSSHIAVVDLDEIIVPRAKDVATISEVISKVAALHPNSNIGSYCFQHVYHEEDTLETPHNKVQDHKKLVSQSRFRRTKQPYPPAKVRSKCIHSSDHVVATDIHSAQWFVNNSVAEVVLSPDVALLHHYRSSPMSFLQHNEAAYGGFIVDTFLLRYNAKLTVAVDAALQSSKAVQQRSRDDL